MANITVYAESVVTAYRYSVNSTLSDLVNGIGTGVDPGTYPSWALWSSETTSNRYNQIERLILVFDTTSIPENSIINSVGLYFNVPSTASGLGDITTEVVRNTGSGTIVDASDYQKVDRSSSFGNFPFPGTGVINPLISLSTDSIEVNDYTRIALITTWDYNNNFNGSFQTDATSFITMFDENTGDYWKTPRLEIDYEPGEPDVESKIIMLI